MEFVERRSGISLWRQIADQIRIAISNGEFDESGALPGELALARRFEVNRHTVRSAIASLAREGVLRVEQGRGTFIARHTKLQYPIGRRTRFSAGLAGQIKSRGGFLKSHVTEAATGHVSRALELEPGAPVLRLERVSSADGVPVSRGISWFDAERFPDFANRYESRKSITAVLNSYDIEDYVRISTRISAHHADPATLDDLKLSPGAITLRTEAVNAEVAGRRLEYSHTFFAADRIELDIDHQAGTALP
ncbi:phosphonate metabolism transcriptional regulator PhnF [Hoeflea prorocentri]|uniref:Phosphonate metabolism transcriptional regulator PhnF n=1 Tax=Hoeflea prorocentri TaxID=1922333 RepID=A0A9X3UJN5_9HYPH|nr:phosphonate metabolism transcriptional regulator PhnF [Hoeflea prorocentri]MCY6382045.1 phosphonate metabolism transcriptional regulator PhnF [Hoeflea prorocentri]MDA5399845.1 phosphonate metabolism transcriptional regulator PhnF [Hoeflea prorocentri]